MMTTDGFANRVRALIKRGYDPDTVGNYAALLGDIIEKDAQGRWVIRDESRRVIDAIEPIKETE